MSLEHVARERDTRRFGGIGQCRLASPIDEKLETKLGADRQVLGVERILDFELNPPAIVVPINPSWAGGSVGRNRRHAPYLLDPVPRSKV